MVRVVDRREADPVLDWAAIEALPEYRELETGRRRFAWWAGGIGVGFGALYVVLAGVAPGLMGTEVLGSVSLGFLGGIALIVMTWAITLAYMRRSDRVWGPLEERVRRRALELGGAPGERFSRDGAPSAAPLTGPEPEASR
jgi:uncharacterized membrane protein (DUF485 family)